MYAVILNMFNIKGSHVNVSPFSVVSPLAQLGENVTIGPYSIIGDDVYIGDNTTIGAHVVITGNTIIGKNNQIFHGAILGEKPQDLKYAGEDSILVIGDNNVIREYVTINKGTDIGGGKTVIGNNNYVMCHAHIAHDVQIANNVIVASYVGICGHVAIEDYAVIGGSTGIHQFVKIGQHAMIGGQSKITKDVLPFSLIEGNPADFYGINSIGLRRRMFSSDARLQIKNAFKRIQNQKKIDLIELQNKSGDIHNTYLIKLISFIVLSTRGYYLREIKNKLELV